MQIEIWPAASKQLGNIDMTHPDLKISYSYRITKSNNLQMAIWPSQKGVPKENSQISLHSKILNNR